MIFRLIYVKEDDEMGENRNVSYALIWRNYLCYNYNIFAVDEEIKKGNVKWFGSKKKRWRIQMRKSKDRQHNGQ
jgi:hypothetical protein